MKTRPVRAKSATDGSVHDAKVAVCDCGGETFHLFQVEDQQHWHFQCVNCVTVYCPLQGACFEETANNNHSHLPQGDA